MFPELAAALAFLNPLYVQHDAHPVRFVHISTLLNAESPHFNEIENLLQQCPEGELLKTDNRNRSLLHLLLKKNAPDNLIYVVLNKQLANMQDKHGNTPLHIALKCKNVTIATTLIYMTDCSLKNKAGQTPLDITFDKELEDLFDIIHKQNLPEHQLTIRTLASLKKRANNSKIKKRLITYLTDWD